MWFQSKNLQTDISEINNVCNTVLNYFDTRNLEGSFVIMLNICL